METKTGMPLIEELKDARRFERLKDGWIKDNALGIDWGPSSQGRMNFSDAQEFAKKMGGRLPHRLEFETIIDSSFCKPAAPKIFTDIKLDDWYWSGTVVAGYEALAWCVSFVYGDVYNCRQGNVNYVRPVRASQ